MQYKSISSATMCQRCRILSKMAEKKDEKFYFGIAYHKGVEEYFLSSREKAVAKAIEFLVNEEFYLEAVGEELEYNLFLLEKMLERVFDFFDIREINIIDSEIRFESQGEEFKELGFIDGYVEYQGKLYLLELKTCAHTSDFGLEADSQLKHYCYQAKNILGLKFDGIIYIANAKKMPKSPSINKDGSLSIAKGNIDPELYLKAIIEIYESLSDAPMKIQERYKQALEEYDSESLILARIITFTDEELERSYKDFLKISLSQENSETENWEEKIKSVPCLPTKMCLMTCFMRNECVEYEKTKGTKKEVLF